MISGFLILAELAGGFGVGAAIMLGWVFRTASAPFVLKLVLPGMLAALAVAMAIVVSAIMGFPVDTRLDSLPRTARLIAFVEDGRQSKIDLWLQEQDQPPRAWRIDDTNSDRKLLAQARKQISLGASVYIRRDLGPDGQHFAISVMEPPTKN